MKIFLITFLILVTSRRVFSFDSSQISEVLSRRLGDQVIVNLDNIDIEVGGLDGEIIIHKVGNGFTIPQNERFFIKKLIECIVPGTELIFTIYEQLDSIHRHAVLRSKSMKNNLAEFLFIQEGYLSAGAQNIHFVTGMNPLNAQMFQIEILSSEKSLLRIVYESQLSFYMLRCNQVI